MSVDYKNIVYCANWKCPHISCLRHNTNTPFNVEIKRDKYELDKNNKCKYRLGK